MTLDELKQEYPLTAPQVAEELGCHRETINRARRDGRLPAIRIRGQWYFRADAAVQLVLINEGTTA